MKKYFAIGAVLAVLLPAVVSAQTAAFQNNLYYGITGSTDVSALQEFRTEQGVYHGPVSGNFFSLTLAGVKAFQKAESVTPVSGYFGPITRGVANTILADEIGSDSEGSATTTQAPVDLSLQSSATSSSRNQTWVAPSGAVVGPNGLISGSINPPSTAEVQENTTSNSSASPTVSQAPASTMPTCTPNPQLQISIVGMAGNIGGAPSLGNSGIAIPDTIMLPFTTDSPLWSPAYFAAQNSTVAVEVFTTYTTGCQLDPTTPVIITATDPNNPTIVPGYGGHEPLAEGTLGEIGGLVFDEDWATASTTPDDWSTTHGSVTGASTPQHLQWSDEFIIQFNPVNDATSFPIEFTATIGNTSADTEVTYPN